MVDSRYNTLIIVEGESLENEFFNKFSNLVSEEKNSKVISFSNNIYHLYKKIKEYGEDITEIIPLILSEIPISQDLRDELSSNKFVYIYLVFDLDLQDNHYDFENRLDIVKEMITIFDDETNGVGKLFVNYPMMESYRDFYFSNVDSLMGRKVESDRDALLSYRQNIAANSSNKSINSFRISDFYKIAKAHLKQANFISGYGFRISKDMLEEEYMLNLHNKQSESIRDGGLMHVVNTSSLIYYYFYPRGLNPRN